MQDTPHRLFRQHRRRSHVHYWYRLFDSTVGFTQRALCPLLPPRKAFLARRPNQHGQQPRSLQAKTSDSSCSIVTRSKSRRCCLPRRLRLAEQYLLRVRHVQQGLWEPDWFGPARDLKLGFLPQADQLLGCGHALGWKGSFLVETSRKQGNWSHSREKSW